MKQLANISITFILAFVLMQTASGQEPAPWLESRNAAGLNTMPTGRNSIAEIMFRKDDGGLVPDEESDDSFLAGAMTESYLKISDRLYFYGKLDYTFFNGRNMGGPILMDPSYNPINFYEASDTTRGVKRSEMYHLAGGIAYDFDGRWSVGAKINYESGDMSKLKDPRFLNVWMDMDLSAGFRFAPSETISFGASLEYRRTLESLTGNIFGTTDKQYFTYIDYGGYFGRKELFDSTDGMVPTSSNRPMFNTFYGGSVQIGTGRKVRTFHQLTFLRRSGYFGERGSTSITYTEHYGNIFGYDGEVSFHSGNDIHRIEADFCFSNLINLENVYRHSTQTGQNTVVEYLSQNTVLDRRGVEAGISYTAQLGIKGRYPQWSYGIRADLYNTASLTTLYPFYRRSSRNTVAASAYGNRNFLAGKGNIITVGLEAVFSTGYGIAKDDGTLAQSTSDSPHSMDICLYRDYEYRTLPQTGGEVTFTYTKEFSERLSGYVRLSERYTTLLKEARYLTGNQRNSFSITLGCRF